MGPADLEPASEGDHDSPTIVDGIFAPGLRDIGPGAEFGRYVVIDEVGRGAMGQVLRVHDPELDRQLALKVVFPSDASSAKRVVREARAMAQLSHPNVVVVYDVGQQAGSVFIAMELVDGVTLGQWLDERKPAWREILAAFLDAGRGLAAAHDAGLIHRDFKPDNVLVGADSRVRVTDFGLARAAEGAASSAPSHDADPRGTISGGSGGVLMSRLTAADQVMGTPAYMAPEQHQGSQIDHRGDQYAFCVALFEALYGARPFTGQTLRELYRDKIQGEPPPPPADSPVPRWVHRVLVRGLRVAPDERWPDLKSLLTALERDSLRRSRRWIALGGATLVAVAMAAWFGRSEVCGGAEQELRGVWDDDRRAATKAALVASELPFADDAQLERAVEDLSSQGSNPKRLAHARDLLEEARRGTAGRPEKSP